MQHFHVTQTLRMNVPNEATSIEHYLCQPQRLVQAITDSSRIQQLAPSHFRLRLRPLQFMMLRFEPIADLQVWTNPDGTLQLRSLNCEIRGAERLNQSFHLELSGKLQPQRQKTITELIGKADLMVQVEIPPTLKLFPEQVLQTTGKAFLNGILLTIKSRLERQLVQDYRRWVRANQDSQISPLATSVGSLAS
ncbi:DUF1997 domain-containing protein [Leptothoe sp. ISB3NOV94-8A]|uniref:DUF1997 domain-containing protein n=1 Tax=Adonisia turfae CCMR0081 TaxID=2292702 RepID=A0A6M0RIU4_9CYAN|nr:DUF1997 domain-containing protein [Adonisia turfae]MDV3352045.1 DUF1997 domain-containing protein [Leptothoe sp. LEGE 181152]NEZ55712.1 DUF1997 domain-containing protein [Adonisia turfae CCMR0081]